MQNRTVTELVFVAGVAVLHGVGEGFVEGQAHGEDVAVGKRGVRKGFHDGFFDVEYLGGDAWHLVCSTRRLS